MLDWIGKGLTACAAAFQFLTRLPVPIHLQYNEALFRRSVTFYPFVGAVLGLLMGLAGWLLQTCILSSGSMGSGTEGTGLNGIAASMLLVIGIALTGALHLDGLMDTADGIFSHRSRAEMLEIMKDSRVGAMGVIACVLLLLCKWTLLQQWLTVPVASLLYLLPLSLLWSRWYMVVAMACWPYARAGEVKPGIGAFFRGLSLKHLGLHTVAAIALSIILVGLSAEGAFFTWESLKVTGVVLLTTALAGTGMSCYLSRKLGGLTGDTYGAMNEILETVLLFILIIGIH